MNRPLALLLPLVAASACGGGMTLQIGPVAPAYVDESSLSPTLKAGTFDRIMIVPPSGSAGVEFQENLAGIERSFIARGITVISPAITSRVILGDETRDRQRAESGLQLSEVERALLLAKQSNADAVLQIGSWQWIDASASDHGARYFVEDKKAKTMVEVAQDEYESAPTKKLLSYHVSGSVLGFTGRLIHVETGEVLASFKIDVPRMNVSDPLTITFAKNGEVEVMSYDPDKDDRRHQAAGQRGIAVLFDRLAFLLAQPG